VGTPVKGSALRKTDGGYLVERDGGVSFYDETFAWIADRVRRDGDYWVGTRGVSEVVFGARSHDRRVVEAMQIVRRGEHWLARTGRTWRAHDQDLYSCGEPAATEQAAIASEVARHAEVTAARREQEAKRRAELEAEGAAQREAQARARIAAEEERAAREREELLRRFPGAAMATYEQVAARSPQTDDWTFRGRPPLLYIEESWHAVLDKDYVDVTVVRADIESDLVVVGGRPKDVKSDRFPVLAILDTSRFKMVVHPDQGALTSNRCTECGGSGRLRKTETTGYRVIRGVGTVDPIIKTTDYDCGICGGRGNYRGPLLGR
jgi:hypothetical protein